MAIVVVAGSGRGAGKTAVGCALMAAMPELRWLAIKITPHGHGSPPNVWEELDRDSEKDTGRYLRAGARRAFLLSGLKLDAAQRSLKDLRSEDAGAALLVESNRVEPRQVARAGEAAICLAVLAGHREAWKPSLQGLIQFADALVLTGGLTQLELPEALRLKRTFCLARGKWSSPELEDAVRRLLL